MKKITSKQVYTDNSILTGCEIFYDENEIISIKTGIRKKDFDIENICPAFFDTHINGGENFYFTQNLSSACLSDIASASRHGGTAFTLPCLITSSLENILKGIEVIKNHMANKPDDGILGLHLEGPYLNLEKRGAHMSKYVRKPTLAEVKKIVKAGKGVIKIWTIAPEVFEEEVLDYLLSQNITLSVGHSNATYEEANNAFEKGIHLVTHLFNAMSGLHHRSPGLVGAALANPRVWAPIILDGHHCHYGAARASFQAKKDKLFLISDALFLNQKIHHFRWEEFDAKLSPGPVYINSEGNLAGGAVSMGTCISHAVKEVGIPLETALDMATRRPAKAIGLEKKIGSIQVGFSSKMLSFKDDLTQFSWIE